ncbi:unnamed protein product [Medioppia subpectinata]|uniref:Uncharacterized protein n=1 Tax=Medioppia subpectinata TaxID=1979941 RepID=A0A7R9KKD9_9ACAR|nr:unnamed protein product [Medioppia subpectinata]CAG2105171.1 unnamed protein product [Medioppia subpectinata]
MNIRNFQTLWRLLSENFGQSVSRAAYLIIPVVRRESIRRKAFRTKLVYIFRSRYLLFSEPLVINFWRFSAIEEVVDWHIILRNLYKTCGYSPEHRRSDRTMNAMNGILPTPQELMRTFCQTITARVDKRHHKLSKHSKDKTDANGAKQESTDDFKFFGFIQNCKSLSLL